jgi:hypothetical protein
MTEDKRNFGALFDDVPKLLFDHRRLVGAAAIALCALTWAVDLLELVYACPYCRAQRTMIGLLGLCLMMPNLKNWLVLYLSSIFAVFGLAVAAAQHFRGWARIMAGEFEWGEQWYVNSWLLSGAALAIMVGLVMLIWSRQDGR